MTARFFSSILSCIALSITLITIDTAAKSLMPIAEYEIEENIRLGKQIVKQLPSNDPVRQKLERDLQNLERNTVPTSLTSARGGELSPRIVNGAMTSSYPQVGALLHKKESDIFRAWCTGTMIACDAFLTAAHCIDKDLNYEHYKVYLQNGGIFNVDKITYQFNVDKITYQKEEYKIPTVDVAVLKLTNKVNGIEPAPINNLARILPPSIGIIVGFGRTGGIKDDPGIKQVGTVKTSSCPFPYSNDNLICWNFEGPGGNPGEDSNTCHGDSGGPLYFLLNHKDRLAGITSGGKDPYCENDDLGYDSSVFKYWEFIEKAAKLSYTLPICGDLPSVGTSDRTIVKSGSGILGEGDQNATFDLYLPPGKTKLRIAMNGVDNGTNNFDLYVRYGGQASADKNDCAAAGPGQFEFCEFNSPAQGEWNITVHRNSGCGSFQVVATIFGQ